MNPTVADIARFWQKVNVPRVGDGCWEWRGAMNGGRDQKWYGRVKMGGRAMYAHRVAFMLARGWPLNYLSDRVVLLHKCDNPKCCRPDHLEIGTQRENVHDMIRKGRRVSAKPVELPV